MDVRAIDPRDQTWEVEPSYRVYFHDTSGAQDEYELRGADVVEGLTWALAEAAGRTFVPYVCVPGDGRGLVRLQGTDPNAH
jgi:hypothetical protein